VTQTEVSLVAIGSAITMTSEGNIAVIRQAKTFADVYSPSLVRQYTIAPYRDAYHLIGIARLANVIFLSDWGKYGIYVMSNNGRTYNHKIDLSWRPAYIATFGDSLYIPYSAKLYKLTLTSGYQKQSLDVIISSSLPSPAQLYVDSDVIAVSNKNDRSLAVFSNDDVYNLKFSYDAPGSPMGITRDLSGNYLLAAYNLEKIQLISPEGQYIQDIDVELPGGLLDIIMVGNNTVYGTIFNPYKMYKLVLGDSECAGNLMLNLPSYELFMMTLLSK
jgi:hypothetical protein